MGQPAGTQGSLVTGVDTHIVMVPSPGGLIPTPLPHPFSGMVDGGTVETVKIMGKPAAVVGSSANGNPPHLPTPPGASFQNPPQNQATVKIGSTTVKIGGKQAARNGDSLQDCDDIAPAVALGQLIAAGTVLIG